MPVTKSELQILVTLKDEASAAFGKFNSKLASATDASKSFAVGLLAGGTALLGFGGMALKAASNAEQSSVAFTTMLGSAEKAQEFIAKMKEFAAKIPFETADIAKAAQTMLAFGMDVKSVMPNVKMIGDVALGNKEKFASLSLAFSQVQATGRLMGQDLLQMVNQGFNPLTIMAEKSGRSMADLKKDMEGGKISADMVTEAFKAATSEGGRFYGGMEAQSKTLAGVWSTLTDTFNEFLRVQGEKFLPQMKEMVLRITDFTTNTLPMWIDKIQEVTNWFGQHKTAIYMVAGAIVGGLTPAIYASIAAFISMAGLLLPFMIGGAIIAGLIAGIMAIIENWDLIKQKVSEVWETIKQFISDSIDAIKLKITEFTDAILKLAEDHQYISGAIIGALSAITALGFIKLVNYVVTEAIPALYRFAVTIITETIPALAKMAIEMTVNAAKALVAFAVSVWTSAIGALVAFATTIWTTVLPAIGAFTLALMTNPIFAIVAIGVAIGVLVALVVNNWDAIKKTTVEVWTSIKDFFASLWEDIKKVFEGPINWINEKIKGVMDMINSVKSAASSVGNYLGGGTSSAGNGLAGARAFGGPVSLGLSYLVGERGPEIFMPSSSGNIVPNSSLGGSNIVVNITGNNINSKLDIRNLADQVSGAIMGKLRLNARV